MKELKWKNVKSDSKKALDMRCLSIWLVPGASSDDGIGEGRELRDLIRVDRFLRSFDAEEGFEGVLTQEVLEDCEPALHRGGVAHVSLLCFTQMQELQRGGGSDAASFLFFLPISLRPAKGKGREKSPPSSFRAVVL